MKRGLKYGLGIVGGVAGVLIAGGVFLTATGPGQRALLGVADWALSSDTLTVETGKLTGSLFGQGAISRISVRDDKGSITKIDQLRFDWSPSDLLAGRAVIRSLQIGRLVLERLPDGEGAATDSAEDVEAPSIPVNAADLVPLPVRIDRFELVELSLGEAVLGAPARMSVSGRIDAENPKEIIAASLSIEDMDRPSFLQANAEYRAETGDLRILLDANEKAGGILTTLLDIDDARTLALGFNGDGRLDHWRGSWQLAVNDERSAGGTLALSRRDDVLAVEMEADGEIGRFAPGAFATLLDGNSRFNLKADYRGKEQIRLRALALDAPRMKLTAAGTADLASYALSGKGRIELGHGQDGQPVVIAVDEDVKISIGHASLILDAIPGSDGIELAASLDAQALGAKGNSVETVSARISAVQPDRAGGFFEILDDIRVRTQLQKPRFADPAIAPVAGEAVTLNLSGRKDASKLTVERMILESASGVAQLSGVLDVTGFNGETRVNIPDSAVFSAIAGRKLQGGIALSVSGNAGPSGDFDVQIDGAGQNLFAGGDAFAKLLEGNPELNGHISRSEDGLRFDALALRSDALGVTADGLLGTAESDLKVTGGIPDIAAILPDSAGAAQFHLELEGQSGEQALSIAVNAMDGRLHGLPMSGVELSYRGAGGLTRQTGEFSAQGVIGEGTLNGRGRIALGQSDGHSIRDFEFSLGGNRLTAQARLPESGEAEGQARLQLNDTGLLSQILGIPMGGGAELGAILSGDASAPQLHITARAPEFSFDTVSIASLDADVTAVNILKQPVFSGQASILSIKADANNFGPVELDLAGENNVSLLTLQAASDSDASLSAKAQIGLPDWRPDVSLSDLALKHPGGEVRQRGTALLRQDGGRITLSNLQLESGKGKLSADAVIGEQIEGKITASSVPLSLAAMFAPDLTVRGSLNGRIDLGGSGDNLTADYSLAVNGAAMPGMLVPGLPDMDLSAAGGLADGTLTIDAKMSGAGGVSARMKGAVRELGAANALDIKADGVVPMRLANSFLALRGTQLDGEARFDLTVSGNADKPAVSGAITASGASLNDPPTGIALADANLAATLSADKVQIESLKARSPNGGVVDASGALDISKPGKLPVSLRLSVQDLDFNDGRIVAGQASSQINLQGDLLGDSRLDGTADIARLDVRIPQALPASVTELDLKHKNAPDHIRILQPRPEKTDKPKTPTKISLSLDVRSANRIFVKGRGLDAQLGGRLALSGSTDDPRAIGQFTLERGRMDILGRTLDITSGRLDFSGDLDPRLNFTATTEADNTQITITITGNASDPQFGFSSVPELPEDEVLAQLLFNKSLAELTPVQLVQLASQVSELGGLTGGPGVLDKLKSSIGIDRLDVTTTDDGEVAVTAGSYVNENLYVGVEQGAQGDSSRVKVDLDITENIKLRGEAGADGESKLGVGVEWEY
ncbi:MAG: translocation/assembly module TamB domain-containing protein [Hyphomicrobiales bacterium]|nr:translocation/assembly module TamB domain-containing protein [Hyphomicrobiales bacterium]